MAPLTIHWAPLGGSRKVFSGLPFSCQVAGYAKELQSLFEIFAAAADMRMLEQVPIFSFLLQLANVARYLPASSKIEFSQTKGQESPHSPPKYKTRTPMRKVQELSDVILSISVARCFGQCSLGRGLIFF